MASGRSRSMSTGVCCMLGRSRAVAEAEQSRSSVAAARAGARERNFTAEARTAQSGEPQPNFNHGWTRTTRIRLFLTQRTQRSQRSRAATKKRVRNLSQESWARWVFGQAIFTAETRLRKTR